ncbi:MAG TPA: YetF domain-containing protein [Chloroflexota bacterium]|nr:YetF domain-containing protein [Chloroflexota bacterium]
MVHNTLIPMFVPSIPILQLILRPILLYLFLLVVLRLAGKRELAQADTFDFVVFLTLANLVQNAGIGPDTSLVGGWIAAGVLIVINYVIVRFLFHRPRIRTLLQGTPTILIDNGQVCEDNLSRELITMDDLLGIVHAQGVPEIAQVERAVLEPGGSIAVFEKHPREMEVLRQELQEIGQKVNELLTRVEPRSATME